VAFWPVTAAHFHACVGAVRPPLGLAHLRGRAGVQAATRAFCNRSLTCVDTEHVRSGAPLGWLPGRDPDQSPKVALGQRNRGGGGRDAGCVSGQAHEECSRQ
jgi:hypothetical protein